MKTVSHEEIMRLKYADRDTVPDLQRHCDGACVHTGLISPACRVCFTGEAGGGIQIGQECNFKCPECYYPRDREDSWESPNKNLDNQADFFRNSMDPNWMPLSYSYQSAGETCLYIDKMLGFSPIFRAYEKRHGIQIYHILYTNGVLIDEEMLDKLKYLHIREIRFHVSASGFSDKVFKAMELVRDNSDITLSVEEPSMPHRRDKILEYLPVFNEMGVKHMNLVEVQLTQDNRPDIEKIYQDEGRIYKEHFYHLYDEGLVYEVMRRRYTNDYGFSVMDCNSMVESYRHGRMGHVMPITKETLEGMCAPFDYGQEI